MSQILLRGLGIISRPEATFRFSVKHEQSCSIKEIHRRAAGRGGRQRQAGGGGGGRAMAADGGGQAAWGGAGVGRIQHHM